MITIDKIISYISVIRHTRCKVVQSHRLKALQSKMFLRGVVRCSRVALLRSSALEGLTTDTKSVLGAQSRNIKRDFSVGTTLSTDVNVTFLKANGDKIQAKGKVGDSLYDVVVKNKVDIVGFGACEGTLTCSTCHLIFKPADFDKLPEKPADEELDMLDLACDLTDHSRLGCQITLTKEMEGLEVTVPATISDARSVD